MRSVLRLEIDKPVLVLHHEGRKISKMLSGNLDGNLAVKTYRTTEEAIHTALRFLSTRG